MSKQSQLGKERLCGFGYARVVCVSEGVRALHCSKTSTQQFHISFPYTGKLLKLYHGKDLLLHRLTQLCTCEQASYGRTEIYKYTTMLGCQMNK